MRRRTRDELTADIASVRLANDRYIATISEQATTIEKQRDLIRTTQYARDAIKEQLGIDYREETAKRIERHEAQNRLMTESVDAARAHEREAEEKLDQMAKHLKVATDLVKTQAAFIASVSLASA